MKNLIQEINTSNVEDTIKIAEEFIQNLSDKNCLIILKGDLGAGKTHFTKGIFKGMGFRDYVNITSPTFDLVNSFHIIDETIHHIDLYRLDTLSQDDKLWLEEILNEKALCIVEWGDKFTYKVSKKIYWIEITILNKNERTIKIFTN